MKEINTCDEYVLRELEEKKEQPVFDVDRLFNPYGM